MYRPTRPKRNRYFKVRGFLKSRHTAGSRSVTLYFYHREKVGGIYRYRLRKKVGAKNYNYSSYTKYYVKTRLPYRGRWRVRALHYDTTHAKTLSTWRYFTVR